jgi:hypothetical protein
LAIFSCSALIFKSFFAFISANILSYWSLIFLALSFFFFASSRSACSFSSSNSTSPPAYYASMSMLGFFKLGITPMSLIPPASIFLETMGV